MNNGFNERLWRRQPSSAESLSKPRTIVDDETVKNDGLLVDLMPESKNKTEPSRNDAKLKGSGRSRAIVSIFCHL